MVLVMVVPTFAPIIIGTALCKVMDPEATKATTSDVEVELLCNIAVISSPIKSPLKGLAVANKIVSATFLPTCCKEEVIRSNANKKSSSAPRMYSTRRMFTTFAFDSID